MSFISAHCCFIAVAAAAPLDLIMDMEEAILVFRHCVETYHYVVFGVIRKIRQTYPAFTTEAAKRLWVQTASDQHQDSG